MFKAAFAKPAIYEYLGKQRVFYAIRLPSNKLLKYEIAPLLTRPVGRPPKRPLEGDTKTMKTDKKHGSR